MLDELYILNVVFLWLIGLMVVAVLVGILYALITLIIKIVTSYEQGTLGKVLFVILALILFFAVAFLLFLFVTTVLL